MSIEIENIIRDALRYREIRKNHNRGYPKPGIPYACGWDEDEDDEGSFYDVGHIREGELDYRMDEVLDKAGIDPDEMYNKLVADGIINDV